MSVPHRPAVAVGGCVGDDLSPSAADVSRFLHASHLLGALLRELLEEQFLGAVEPRPLTRTQFCVLKLVTLNPELALGDIARCLGVTAPASTKMADKLERMGLLHRRPYAEDRRVVRLEASPEGRALVQSYEAFKADRVGPVVAGLGDEAGDRLCDLLNAVCGELLDRQRPQRRPCLRCAGYFRPDCEVARRLGGCALAAARTEVEA